MNTADEIRGWNGQSGGGPPWSASRQRSLPDRSRIVRVGVACAGTKLVLPLPAEAQCI